MKSFRKLSVAYRSSSYWVGGLLLSHILRQSRLTKFPSLEIETNETERGFDHGKMSEADGQCHVTTGCCCQRAVDDVFAPSLHWTRHSRVTSCVIWPGAHVAKASRRIARVSDECLNCRVAPTINEDIEKPVQVKGKRFAQIPVRAWTVELVRLVHERVSILSPISHATRTKK